MSDGLPNTVAETLGIMVGFDTVNGAISGRADAEADLGTWIAAAAEGSGFTARRLPLDGHADQVLIIHRAPPGAPWLLFDSHMDTVSVDGMTIDPFGAEIRGRRLYGRGACDTKGTGAAMLWALRRYASDADQPNNVALLFSVDEEIAMTGIQSFLTNDYANLGFTPRGVIVGEPTDLHPVVSHNGVVRWRLATRGVSAHASVPHEGRSAISAMARVIQAIESQYIAKLTGRDALTGPAVCSINLIRGGSSTNVIPDHCEIQIDRRLVPGEDPDSVLPEVRRLLETLDTPDDVLDFTQEMTVKHPPLTTDHNESLAASAKRVLADAALPTMTVGAPFATHASYFDRAGVPAIAIGPGDPHPAHTADEWISLEKLDLGVEVYLGLMRCGANGG